MSACCCVRSALDVLGSARRVVVSKDDTMIVDGGGTEDDVAARVAQLRGEIENTDSDWDREKLEERLAKLAGGVAVIKVGAATETALKERKAAVEDAVHAAKAAVEEGIVAGGGSALVQAGKALARPRRRRCPATRRSVSTSFASALTAPLFWIATNAGLDGSVVVNKVAELPAKGHGFNAATLTYGDLVADGVIDPVKVTRSAVLNAASVARMVLTTETAIVEKPAEADETPGTATTATRTEVVATKHPRSCWAGVLRCKPLFPSVHCCAFSGRDLHMGERSVPSSRRCLALVRTTGAGVQQPPQLNCCGRLVSRHGPHLAVGVGSVRTEVFVGDLRAQFTHRCCRSTSVTR